MNLPPDGHTVRSSTREDIEAIARLVQTIDRHDEGIVEPVRGHIEDEWANPLFDAEQDTLVVAAESGELAAYASAWGIEPSTSVEAWINVHPDHRGRGLGTWLVDWAEARTRRYLDRPGTSTLLRPSVSPSGAGGAFLQGLGYRHVRTFWHMERRLEGTEQAGNAPDGVSIRPYRDGDAPSCIVSSRHRSKVTSVSSRWPTTRGKRRCSGRLHRTSRSSSWPSGAGSWSGRSPRRSTRRSRGWPSWACSKPIAGSGSAGRSCGERSQALAARGWTIVKLNVDGENRSGATRLYESAGMTRGRSWHFYEKRIDAD